MVQVSDRVKEYLQGLADPWRSAGSTLRNPSAQMRVGSTAAGRSGK